MSTTTQEAEGPHALAGELVLVESIFTADEKLAVAGFLAGYSGLTHDAYALDLRQFTGRCIEHHLHFFGDRRADIERLAWDMEARGRARSTIARRLCTVAGRYRYAVEEDLLEHSPAVHVRQPRQDYDSHAVGPDRNEVSALLVAAGLGGPIEHALISLLAIKGLRVSEAIGADIEALVIERDHRTLTILRKGGKIVAIPLAPRTARAVDQAVGERPKGPIFLRHDGRRLDRHGAGRIARRVTRRAGIDKQVVPHTLRHAFITAALDAGVPLCDVQEAASHADPRTTHAVRPREDQPRPARDLRRRRLLGGCRSLTSSPPVLKPTPHSARGLPVVGCAHAPRFALRYELRYARMKITT